MAFFRDFHPIVLGLRPVLVLGGGTKNELSGEDYEKPKDKMVGFRVDFTEPGTFFFFN
jgi:hypothetical protein